FIASAAKVSALDLLMAMNARDVLTDARLYGRSWLMSGSSLRRIVGLGSGKWRRRETGPRAGGVTPAGGEQRDSRGRGGAPGIRNGNHVISISSGDACGEGVVRFADALL